MNRILLLLTLFLIGSATLATAQSEPSLGKASTFAVLGTGYVSNTGVTGVTGDVGMSPTGVFTDNGELLVKGSMHMGLPLATTALQDAKAVYDYWRGVAGTPFTGASLKANGTLPGVYRSSGNVNLDGIIVLDGNGDVNSKFIFIVEGDLTTPSPIPPSPGTGLLLQNGAQPKNIFWIVKGKVKLGNSTSFQGTIISEGDIILEPGVNLIGRAISIDGGVSLNNNNIFLPNVIIADLSVAKVAEKGEYKIGDEITYTITVTNAGPGEATNVVVDEIMPAQLEFVRVASVSTGTYDPSRREWVIEKLKLNETAVLKLTFKIVAAGKIVNKVKVGSNNPDPKPGNNEGEDPVDVPVISADLSIIKTASGAPYVVGGTVTYTIVTKNNGPYAAENVVVEEQLPNSLELVSYTVSKGTFDPATGKYTVGTLAKDETATLTIVAKILKAGQILNVASVGTTTPDPNPGDNEDPEPIDVTCPVATVAIDGGAAQCAETANVIFTVTEILGATYNFELTGGLTEVSRAGNSITVNIGNASGKVIAKVTDQCGTTYTAEKEIKVTTTPAAPAIAGNTSVCGNTDGVTYTAEGPEGATYEWSATGDVQIVDGQNGKKVTVNVGANGGTLSVKASNECFTSQATTINITAKTPPAAPTAISGDAALCVGSKVTYTIPEVDGATEYNWTVPTGWIIEKGQGSKTIEVVVGTAGGNITVSAANECGASASVSLAVTVKDKPVTPGAISGGGSACAGQGGVTYTINPVNGATEYIWTVPTGWVINSGQGTASITVTAGTAPGNISVVAKNECGSSAPATMPLTVNTIPEAPASIAGSASACEGTTQTYTIDGVAGATAYNWTVPTGWTIESGQGTGTIKVKIGSNTGDVTVTASNACGTSTAISKAVAVTTPPAKPGAITGPSAACGNTGDHTYTISPVTGATKYTWTVPQGWVIESGQGSTTIKVKAGTNSGDVTVKAENDCGASEAAVFTTTVSNAPQTPLSIKGSGPSCHGSTVTYSVEGAAGTNYTWTVPATWTLKNGQGSSTIEVEVGNGSGEVTVTASNACGEGATAKLDVAPAPAPAAPGAIEGPNVTCSNSENLVYSVTVLSGGDKYNWTVPEGWTIISGQGTLSITVNAGTTGGEVSVVASNDCGTTAASTLNVTVNTLPDAPVAIKDMSTLCGGLEYSIDAVPGATDYTWSVPMGFTIVSGQGTTTIKVKLDDPNAFGDVSVVANNGACAGPATSLPIDKTKIEGDLTFPKAFSPNGDGKNDTWVIENLLKYPKNQVVVFNRWGSEVYKKDNYQNDWNGNKLEPGTYFYRVSVTMCDGAAKTFTGYVTIFR